MIDEPEFRFRIHRYLIRRDEAGSRKKLFSTIIRDVDKATDFIESGGREGTAVSVFCFVDVKEKRKKAHLKEGGEGDEASLGSTLLPDSHSLNGGNVGGWKKRNKKLWTLCTRATIASPFHLSIFRGGVASRVSCVEGDTESTAPLSRFRFPIPRVELRRKDYGFSRPFTRPRSIRNSNLFLRDERISLRLQANQLDDK